MSRKRCSRLFETCCGARSPPDFLCSLAGSLADVLSTFARSLDHACTHTSSLNEPVCTTPASRMSCACGSHTAISPRDVCSTIHTAARVHEMITHVIMYRHIAPVRLLTRSVHPAHHYAPLCAQRRANVLLCVLICGGCEHGSP